MSAAAGAVSAARDAGSAVGFWRETLRRYRRNRPAWVAAWLLLAIALIALFADVVAPYDTSQQFFERPGQTVGDPLAPRDTGKFEAPSWEHPLGTDQLARDVFSRTVVGPTAFGRAELFGLSADLLLLFLAIALTSWPTMARLVRGQLLAIRQQDHVLAAESLGCSPARVALRHMLPLALPVMLVEATFLVPRAIAAEAALSFIGIGAAPPTPSLGVLAHDHFAFVGVQWSALAISTGVLVLLFLVLQLVGEGIEQALEPRRRSPSRVLKKDWRGDRGASGRRVG